MAVAVVMPKSGDTVKTCIIGTWRKKPGDKVEMGDILFTYETDKASFECVTTAAGTLLEIFFEDGDEVPVMTNVCAIGESGEDASALRPGSTGAAVAPPEPEKRPEEAAPALEERISGANDAPMHKISPRARNLAQRSGVDPMLAVPTGPGGRIVEEDIRRLLREGTPSVSAETPAEAATASAPDADYDDAAFPGIRKVIGKSMMASLQGSAQLTHHFAFDASAIQRYRAQMKVAGGDYAGVTLGDMVLFAVSRTLLKHPDLNAHMLDDTTIRRFRTVHLGVAVDTARGLLVPVIRNANTKTLVQISKEVKELAAQAATGSISPDKMSGATFTVSNLGSFDVEMFTPILNPPQTGIIGVCKMIDRPRRCKDGSIDLYPAMGLSLTYDHRAVDGAPASRFMQDVCRNLEQFTTLLAN